MFCRMCHCAPPPQYVYGSGIVADVTIERVASCSRQRVTLFLRTKNRIKIVGCASWNSTNNCVHFFFFTEQNFVR